MGKFEKRKSDIWFTSDTHYNHKNICRSTTSWTSNLDRCRDFDSLSDMNDAIVKGINTTVRDNDILYHLGDWSFGGVNSIWEFRKRIHCKNIHLILGNHDHHIENNRMILIPINEIDTYKELVSPLIFNTYIHEVNMECDDKGNIIGYQIPIRTLFSSVNQLLIKEIGGQNMTLCHYAMRTWDKGHHGSWMLFGHSHGNLDEYANYYMDSTGNTLITDKFRTIDVGIDSVHNIINEYRPFSIEEIKNLFKDRLPLMVDHHNQNTN